MIMRASIALVLLNVVLVCGCAKPSTPTPAVVPPAAAATPDQDTELSWWHAEIKVHWPEKSEPNWAADVLLASEVIAPILNSTSPRIPMWRFHRRAMRDSAGHNFSFIFYAPAAQAHSVLARIAGDALINKLITAKIIDNVQIGPALGSNLEDTSDPAWSTDLQRAWPYFAMGASQLWLGLVRQNSPQDKSLSEHPQKLLAAYRETSKHIDEIWRRQGQHALIHHLSALFAYAPIAIKTQIEF